MAANLFLGGIKAKQRNIEMARRPRLATPRRHIVLRTRPGFTDFDTAALC